MKSRIQGPLRIAVIGAAGNVGNHISALLVNALSVYYQENGYMLPKKLSGRYSPSFIQAEKLNSLFQDNLQKFSVDASQALPINIDLVLNNSNHPNSSSYQFRNAVGFGFHPAPEDEVPGENSRIEIPKSDLNKLGVRIIENIHECVPGYHLAISVVTEQALRNDAFCAQLGKLVHEDGQLALSMNGIPPYFLELFDDASIRGIDNTELPINKTESGANVMELLGGPNKLIGVVLTVADSTEQINTAEGSFHITRSAKIRSKCKLGSRKVILNDRSPKAISPNFFQNLGLCIGLGTSTELFLEYAILQKLAVNFILNPISALCPGSVGDLINIPGIKALMLRLNDQFSFMVTSVLGLQGDILYKGELLIKDRLPLSATHTASTRQGVNARRRIEYINLRTFLDLVLLVAEKKQLVSARSQLEITIRLFELFKKIYDFLEAYAKDSAQPIDQQLEAVSSELSALVRDAEKIETIQNPVLQNVMTTFGLITEISLCNQMASLTAASNDLRSLTCHLANYANFLAMVSKLPVSPDPAIQAKLQEIKLGIEMADRQITSLLSQPSAFYNSSGYKQDDSNDDHEPDAKRPCCRKTTVS